MGILQQLANEHFKIRQDSFGKFKVGRVFEGSVSPTALNNGETWLDEAQGSICCWELTGVQHLYACIMVAIERCHGTRTTCVDSLCRIRKPKSKVVQLNCNRAGVKDEGLIAEDPSYV